MKKGLFILAHGSRAAEANDQLFSISEKARLNKKNEFDLVGYGSMELSKPSFAEGINTLVKEGAESVVIVPLFLFKGNHIKKDIPKLLEEIKKEHPGVEFKMTTPVGEDDRVVDILLDNAVKG
ncbi:CbiX/SirB N-terminal domain-containing protein [Proteinivorax tanatarense]|uniref:CbiX/SirB N-terminal domain-containing protein n=1 Tax=Proteinivorax tanatarense TaxID=1260629 RepID=A0AAU7VJJ9_9FIRM